MQRLVGWAIYIMFTIIMKMYVDQYLEYKSISNILCKKPSAMTLYRNNIYLNVAKIRQ